MLKSDLFSVYVECCLENTGKFSCNNDIQYEQETEDFRIEYKPSPDYTTPSLLCFSIPNK